MQPTTTAQATDELTTPERWQQEPLDLATREGIKANTDPAARDYIERLEAILDAGIELWRIHGSGNREAISDADCRFRDMMDYFDFFDE